MIARWLRRGHQFWRHSAGRVSADEAARAAEILGQTLAELFRSLPVSEQRHGLDVLATVERLDGLPGRLLQQSALLHDMGKAQAHFSVVDRSLAVLLEALSPSLRSGWLRLRPGFRARYAIYRDHAAIGASRLVAAGAAELAAVVAEHHHPQPSLEATRRLRQADGLN